MRLETGLLLLWAELVAASVRPDDASKGPRKQTPAEAEARACETGCVREMMAALAPFHVDVHAGIQVGSQLFARTEREIQDFCRGYLSGRGCLKACTKWKPRPSVLTRMLSAFEFMCVERLEELLEHVPCLNRSQAAVAASCDPRCQTSKVIDLQGPLSQALATNDYARLNIHLGEICAVVSCSLNCQRGILQERCGNLYAFGYLKGFVNAAFSPIKALVSQMAAEESWEPACEQLADPSIAFREEPLTEHIRRPGMLTAIAASLAPISYLLHCVVGLRLYAAIV